MAKPTRGSEPDRIVTFPIRVTGAIWDRFKERAEAEGRPAHTILVEFVTRYGNKKPKQK